MSSKLSAVQLSGYWAKAVIEVTQEIQQATLALEEANRKRLDMLKAIESVYGSDQVDEVGLKVYIPEGDDESSTKLPASDTTGK